MSTGESALRITDVAPTCGRVRRIAINTDAQCRMAAVIHSILMQETRPQIDSSYVFSSCRGRRLYVAVLFCAGYRIPR
jgi:hypothetical protein